MLPSELIPNKPTDPVAAPQAQEEIVQKKDQGANEEKTDASPV